MHSGLGPGSPTSMLALEQFTRLGGGSFKRGGRILGDVQLKAELCHSLHVQELLIVQPVHHCAVAPRRRARHYCVAQQLAKTAKSLPDM